MRAAAVSVRVRRNAAESREVVRYPPTHDLDWLTTFRRLVGGWLSPSTCATA